MKKGLVLGKFMPLHEGHLALINFAQENCDHLVVLLCYTPSETIPATLRKSWLSEIFKNNSKLDIISFQYNEKELPNTSVSSLETSFKWAMFLKSNFPDIKIFFSSEEYGGFIAKFLNIEHKMFDEMRFKIPISSTQIRHNPFAYWQFIPEIVRPFYVKKIAILGSESTGKSTLTKKLAQYFKTTYVPEMAREIVEHTNECSIVDLIKIAELHAKAIASKVKSANKLLFIDTDLNITKSYALFLFNCELKVDNWIEEINQMDLYFFLDDDCPFVQDGTRLSELERNNLSAFHKSFLYKKQVNIINISGDWSERFHKVVAHISTHFDYFSNLLTI
jgi:HTH-type transcriptional repressor of NAD biosynthesis genes